MKKERITCSKSYLEYPFAHRQPKHDGHCAYIHGHNWSFDFEFACSELDENGFVIDFGKLKFIKAFLDVHFDHGFVVAQDDPELERWEELFELNLVKLSVVPDTSAEGLAKWLHEYVNKLVDEETKGRVWVSKVTVWEDSHDKATYEYFK